MNYKDLREIGETKDGQWLILRCVNCHQESKTEKIPTVGVYSIQCPYCDGSVYGVPQPKVKAPLRRRRPETIKAKHKRKPINQKPIIIPETDTSTKKVLDTLTEREAFVLIHRFGLSDGPPKTLDAIGDDLGVGRDRVRQLCSKALRKCRHPSREEVVMELAEQFSK